MRKGRVHMREESSQQPGCGPERTPCDFPDREARATGRPPAEVVTGAHAVGVGKG